MSNIYNRMHARFVLALCTPLFVPFVYAHTLNMQDDARNRSIPITVDLPEENKACTIHKKCKVAFVSAGYRVPYTKYSFISNKLNSMGYLTVAVDHEMPDDPPLSKKGDLYTTRIENWQRGAKTLDFLYKNLPALYPEYDFDHLLLVGHSNGGDISTWLSKEKSNYIDRLITLDHRRVALPKSHNIRVLSLRASEYITPDSVLLTPEQQRTYDGCIIEIPESKHMDLTDYGASWVKQRSLKIIEGFLSGDSCSDLRAKI